jgi:ABC-type multidrug transport system fused ATPase/permease subunit
MNGYFLLNYPTVGAVNITGNLASLGVIYNNYKRILVSSIEREELFLKLIEKIDEKMNNMMNIFLNNKTDDAIKSSSDIEKGYLKHYKQQYRDLEWFSTSVKLTNYIFSGICLYILYKTAKTKEDFVNGLLIYTFYIQTFETIIEEIPRYMVMISNIKHIEHYLERKIYDRLNKPIKYTNSIDNFKGDIVFNDVSFKYDKIDTSYNSKTDKTESINSDLTEEKNVSEDKDSNVINNLNLTIKEGDRVAMYAKSGSGKSTLMKLLLGFYKPQSGYILLDGIEISTVNPSLIREKINYINQRTLLFQDTIINNMKYGNNKTDKEIIDFLSKYDLLTIFKNCDKNKDTCLNNIIEGNGLNMSMGMQKIIFLVRGILKDSVVYIFDEPLTSLDPKTREKIINMIDKETKGKTLIIITHDKEISSIVNIEVNLLEIQGKKPE